MVEYLKKSDVMAAMPWNRYAQDILKGIPTHIFPEPTDAPVGSDLISRKDLRDKIARQHLENEMLVGWNASINALLRIINSMPSISSAPESGNIKLLEMIDAGLPDNINSIRRLLGWLRPILREMARLLAERRAI